MAVDKRIIPTRMGTRKFWKCQLHRHRDHPHAYGDKICFKLFEMCIIGSSPRVWGQDKANMEEIVEARIIPTRMGTSIVKLADYYI